MEKSPQVRGSVLSSFPNDIKFVHLPACLKCRSGLSSFPNDIKWHQDTNGRFRGSALSSFPNAIKSST